LEALQVSSLWITTVVIAAGSVAAIRFAVLSWRGDFSQGAPDPNQLLDQPTTLYLRLASTSVANAASLSSLTLLSCYLSLREDFHKGTSIRILEIIATMFGIGFLIFGFLSMTIYIGGQPKWLVPPKLRK
jgi:hypothetical protein